MESLLSVVATADADLEVQEALEVQADPAVVAVVVDHNQTHPEDLQHRDLVVAELVMDLKVATALTRQQLHGLDLQGYQRFQHHHH